MIKVNFNEALHQLIEYFKWKTHVKIPISYRGKPYDVFDIKSSDSKDIINVADVKYMEVHIPNTDYQYLSNDIKESYQFEKDNNNKWLSVISIGEIITSDNILVDTTDNENILPLDLRAVLTHEDCIIYLNDEKKERICRLYQDEVS